MGTFCRTFKSSPIFIFCKAKPPCNLWFPFYNPYIDGRKTDDMIRSELPNFTDNKNKMPNYVITF